MGKLSLKLSTQSARVPNRNACLFRLLQIILYRAEDIYSQRMCNRPATSCFLLLLIRLRFSFLILELTFPGIGRTKTSFARFATLGAPIPTIIEIVFERVAHGFTHLPLG